MNTTIIYIRILEAKKTVYRAVNAHEISEEVYQIESYDIYDPAQDDAREFVPGTIVEVESRNYQGQIVLVAFREFILP